MAEVKERSVIFKFFYVLLRIVTFPIYFVFLIFRHPLSCFFVVLVLLCGLIYMPLSEGAKKDEILEWYKAKYFEIKYQAATIAKETGTAEYLPESMQRDIVEIAKEAQELERPKSENYNDKVDRVEEVEKTTAELRKRRGFKKKESIPSVSDSEELKENEVAETSSDAEQIEDNDALNEIENQDLNEEAEEMFVSMPEDKVEEPLMPDLPAPEIPQKSADEDDDLDLF